jgi:hypothetical protein
VKFYEWRDGGKETEKDLADTEERMDGIYFKQ